MKYLILALALLLTACTSLLPHPVGATNMASADAEGIISKEALLAQYPPFAAEYSRYQPDAAEVQQIQNLQGLQLVVLFGTWCHDSEREVPRLLKLLQQANVATDNLQLQAVNRQKQHPQQLHSYYNLKYTPTIIVLQNGKELGRIIERPQQSLAGDLAKIAEGGE